MIQISSKVFVPGQLSNHKSKIVNDEKNTSDEFAEQFQMGCTFKPPGVISQISLARSGILSQYRIFLWIILNNTV